MRILPYSTELKDHFYSINEEWVSKMFEMEPIDEEVLKDPDSHIIDKGGYIWFVEHSEKGIVGTCALKKTGEGEYELTKMGVIEEARGLKAGEFLLKFVLSFIKENNISYCYLLTNKKCEAAIHLYEKNGFVHSQEVMEKFGGFYERANVAMLLC